MLCVKACPKTDSDKIDCLPNNDITSCDKLNVYSSYAFGNRICVPKSPQMTNTVMEKMNVN